MIHMHETKRIGWGPRKNFPGLQDYLYKSYIGEKFTEPYKFTKNRRAEILRNFCVFHLSAELKM